LYYIALAVMYLIAILPDFILVVVFKPLIYLLVYRVAGYRVKVVRDNLTK
jgi:KDO2-lipid IV(A) lauroyltransferase